MKKTVLVLRHVHFEDLGSFAEPLAAAGYGICYHEVGGSDPLPADPGAADLLIVLGGPIGVYETEAYPFLTEEIAFVRYRLAEARPTLGICLGAQLLAVALGGRVFPSGMKEIGFSQLALTSAGRAGPLRHLAGVAVLHWHGDTYTLPDGATHLASSTLIEQQAFAIGSNILGLQFHPEAETDSRFEHWLIGHAAEIATAGIDPRMLREEGRRNGPRLRLAAREMLAEWLEKLESGHGLP